MSVPCRSLCSDLNHLSHSEVLERAWSEATKGWIQVCLLDCPLHAVINRWTPHAQQNADKRIALAQLRRRTSWGCGGAVARHDNHWRLRGRGLMACVSASLLGLMSHRERRTYDLSRRRSLLPALPRCFPNLEFHAR